MKTHRILLGTIVLLGFRSGSFVTAEEPIRSGIQPGEKVLATFEPLNITGPFANEPHCLVCENGLSPVAMVFARKLTEPVIRLLVEIDAATAKNKSHEMGSFVTFLSDREDLAPQLQEVAKKHGLKHIILSIDPPAGPEGFKVSSDAELTVVFYDRHVVRANQAFAAGAFTEKSIPKVMADLPKILPAKPAPR